MKKRNILLFIILPLNLLAQKTPKSALSTTSIKTLEYIYEKVEIDGMDDFFIERGFVYNGSSRRGDTVTLLYRRPDSYTRISVDLINDRKYNVSYYSQFDLAARYIINTAKASGYKNTKNNIGENQSSASYDKFPYLLMYFKSYYPEDKSSAYRIIIGRVDRN